MDKLKLAGGVAKAMKEPEYLLSPQRFAALSSPLLRHLPEHRHRRLPQPGDVRPHRRVLLPLPAVEVRHDLVRPLLDPVGEPGAFALVGALPPAAAQAL